MIARFAALALAAVASMPALAAGPLVVTTRLLVEQRVAAADGTTRVVLAEPKKVVPGDRVTVVLAYRNIGTQPIANLVLANPVPRGMAYRAPAKGSPAPELSGPSAGTVTQVRWRLPAPVKPGEGGELAFEAVLQ